MAILLLLENCLNWMMWNVFSSFFFPNPYCLTKLFPFPSPTTAALKSSSSSNLLFPSRGIMSSRYCFPSCSVSAQLQINRSSIFLDAVLPSLCPAGLKITAGHRTMTGQKCLLTGHFFTSPVILTGNICMPSDRILNRFFSLRHICWNRVRERLYSSWRVRNFTVSTSSYVRQKHCLFL